MNNRDFCRSLRKAEETLRSLDLLEEVRQLVSLTPSSEFKRAALSLDTRYSELYRIGLSKLDYNLLLTDLSYFQFHCTEGGVRPGVRYAFYPNPYPVVRFSDFFAEQSLIDENVTYEHYLQHLSEMEELMRVPLMRFDLATSDYRPLEHPAAHMHIGLHGENRWPCARVITPRGFILLVAKLYYPEAWAQQRGNADAALMLEKTASLELARNLFSQDEERQFYIG